jgi:hypothetical protein
MFGYARRHSSAATSAAIENIGFEVAPHHPQRPSDFWLFAAINEGIQFACDEKVQAAAGK